MFRKAVIGLAGERLTAEERCQLAIYPPLGVILFARNTSSPEQVKALLADVRDCTGQATWAAIDEEGGRVNRMPWAPFDKRKHAVEYGLLYQNQPNDALKAVFDDSLQVGEALADLGFTHNCAPILDVFHASAHDIIGKRAFSSDVDVVIACANACLQGLKHAGIEGIGKHYPGHGRANADSHLATPSVDAGMQALLNEARPFSSQALPELHHIMTAHVIYPAIDTVIATFSAKWLQDILRKELAFQGLIWSDDLCMKGTGMDIFSAAQCAERAGCDVLLICDAIGVDNFYQSLLKTYS